MGTATTVLAATLTRAGADNTTGIFLALSRATSCCRGRAGGSQSIVELRPEVAALARKLSRRRPTPALRAIAAELAAGGHLASSGKPFEVSLWRDAARLIANAARSDLN